MNVLISIFGRFSGYSSIGASFAYANDVQSATFMDISMWQRYWLTFNTLTEAI